jgi:hypothetical protein
MKNISLVLLFAVSLPAFARPHMDLDMTGPEYLRLLKSSPKTKNKMKFNPEDRYIEQYLAIGKRNLEWVDFVNAHRDEAHKISLSSPATQPGNGINNPRTYNFRIIKERWDILKNLLPAPLKKVLLEDAPFTADIGVSDREFIEWLFQIDASYQIAARYKMMLPYKDEMAGYAAYDVRGYNNLLQEDNLDEKLSGFSTLNQLTQTRLAHDLLLLCMNKGTARVECLKEIEEAKENNTLVAYKDDAMVAGKANYDSFFNILGARPDGVWTASNPLEMNIPFRNPHNEKVLDFLKYNIEDEWQWDGWKLILNFVDSEDEEMTRVEFEAGATPHVESAPGHIITMDQNAPLSEYDVQWTIRHEYGHVIGFPDCYHEFYDEEQEAFVSYQLDVTNLMCSRRGHIQQMHFDELKKAYFKE